LSREGLERWRTLIPGILLLVYGYAGALAAQTTGSFGDVDVFVPKTLGLLTGAAIVLGWLYRIARFRDPVFKPAVTRIQQNIKLRLLAMHATDPVLAERREALLQGRILIEVFYKFVDKEGSLQEKAKGIRANGLALSSLADAQVISLAFGLLYLTIAAIDWLLGLRFAYVELAGWRFATFAFLAVVLGLIAASARIVFPICEARHRELSNEQLDHIEVNCREELRNALRDV
jgi:hypothetical protein